MTDLVTDEELARARQDPAFRHQLMATHLARLVAALNRTRIEDAANPHVARQMSEGAALAVKLAGRIQKDDAGSGPKAA